jgi:hypothetical protein
MPYPFRFEGYCQRAIMAEDPAEDELWPLDCGGKAFVQSGS